MLIGVILNVLNLKQLIDSFGFQTELAQDDERIVRSTFNIKLNGYIVPEILQKDINSIKKFSDTTKIIFSIEASSMMPYIMAKIMVMDRLQPQKQ
jgi:hypothetical protein